MTTTAQRPAPMMIFAGARIAAALAVAALVSAACVGAAHESRLAVRGSSAAISRATLYVTLPAVEIVARRQGAGAVAAGTARSAAPTL